VKHKATEASRFCNSFGTTPTEGEDEDEFGEEFVFKMCASKPLCAGGFLRLLSFDLMDLLPHWMVVLSVLF
jgi:hypothetical protein